MALPSRKIKSLKELFEIFPGAKDIFIDGTETPIQRPISAGNIPKRHNAMARFGFHWR
jgi:hypothetical protein